MRGVLRAVLLALGLGCAVVFLTYSRQETRAGAATTVHTTVGFWLSPWLVMTETTTEDPAQGRFAVTSQHRVEFLSWSWAFLALAGASLVLAAKLSPSSDVHPRT